MATPRPNPATTAAIRRDFIRSPAPQPEPAEIGSASEQLSGIASCACQVRALGRVQSYSPRISEGKRRPDLDSEKKTPYFRQNKFPGRSSSPVSRACGRKPETRERADGIARCAYRWLIRAAQPFYCRELWCS